MNEPGSAAPLDLDAMIDRAETLARDVHASLFKGRRLQARIPARPDEDHDIVAARVAQDLQSVCAEVRRLRDRVTELEQELAGGAARRERQQ